MIQRWPSRDIEASSFLFCRLIVDYVVGEHRRALVPVLSTEKEQSLNLDSIDGWVGCKLCIRRLFTRMLPT